MANQKLDELSFSDIFNFLIQYWKKLVISLVFGALMGICYNFFYGVYLAKGLLYPIAEAPLSQNAFMTIQSSLADVASKRVRNFNLSGVGAPPPNYFTSNEWWNKAIFAEFSEKDPSISGGVVKLMQITGSSGASKEQASTNLELVKDFFINAGVYIQIINMLRNNAVQNTLLSSSLQVEVNEINLENKAKQKLIKELELIKSVTGVFPLAVNANQPFTMRESAPVSVQIELSKSDISRNIIRSIELNNKLEKIVISNSFLDKFNEMAKKNLDGYSLLNELFLYIESESNNNAGAENGGSYKYVLDNFKNEFTKVSAPLMSIELYKSHVFKTTSMAFSIVIGASVGFCLMLLVILVRNFSMGLRPYESGPM